MNIVLMKGVKAFSWKRLAWSVPLGLALFVAAGFFACGTGLDDGSGRWYFRDHLGAVLLPAAFLSDNFEQVRGGFFVPGELPGVMPLQFLYAYLLLTLGAIIKEKSA